MSCPHLIKEGDRQQWCALASNKIGRLFPTNEVMCEGWCQSHRPKDQPKTTPEGEKSFLAKALQFNMKREPGGLTAAKVIESYQKPADIATPEEWLQIQESLSFLYHAEGFKAILITGSAIASNAPRPLKDIDLDLWFRSIEDLMNFRAAGGTLPKEIAGLKADYFYHFGGEYPDQFFVTLDPIAKKLYLSRWFKLNLRSLEEGYEVIENSMLPMDDVMLRLIQQSQADPMIPVRREWVKVRPLWEKVQSLLSAAASRGLVATGMDAAGFESSGGIKVAPEVLAQRERSCFGGNGQMECELLKQSEEGPYCGGCGCGASRLALLKRKDGGYNKLEYPDLGCPKTMPGFSNAFSQLTE